MSVVELLQDAGCKLQVRMMNDLLPDLSLAACSLKRVCHG